MEHLEFAKYKELYETFTGLRDFAEMYPDYCDEHFGKEFRQIFTKEMNDVVTINNKTIGD